MIGVGGLGASNIGNAHAQNIHLHSQILLAAVADVNEPAAPELVAKYGAQVKAIDACMAGAFPASGV